ncbi:MAG: hypothetical protein NVSMB44_15450 [Ktedonobacteraceae bacterium]
MWSALRTLSTTPGRHTLASQQKTGWNSLFEWFEAATFSPDWVARPWSRPVAGYALAFAGQLLAITVIAVLSQFFPTLRFCESLLLLVVFLMALGWGIGPAFIATCAGATALLILWLSFPSSALFASQVENLLRFILYIATGLTLTILTSRAQQARYTAQAFGQRLEEIINALPDPLVFYDASGQVIHSNEAARTQGRDALLDLSLTRLANKSHMLDAQGGSPVIDDLPLARALRGESVMRAELGYTWPDDAHEQTVSVSATPLRAQADDSIIGAVTITHDLSALREAESEATRRAQQLEAMLESVPDALFLVNQEGKTIRMNRAARALLPIEQQEEYNSFWRGTQMGAQLFIRGIDGHALDPEEWPSARILRGEILTASNAIELILRGPDGRDLFVSVMGGPVCDAEQRVVGAVAVMRDVTENRVVVQRVLTSEHEAAERSRQLEATFNAMTDGVVIYDALGNMQRVNAAYRQLIGLDKAPQHAKLTPAERGAMLALRDEYGRPLIGPRQPVQRMLAGEVFTASQAMDIQVHTLDGREVQLNVTGTPMYDQEQRLTGGVLIFRDVTTRRKLERRTQEALEALLTMAEELVQLPEQAERQDATARTADGVSKPLAELIRRVLGCQRVSLTGVNQQTHELYSLAVVGLSPELERHWRERQSGFNLHEILSSAVPLDPQKSNDPFVVDFTRPPLSDYSNPFGIQSMILAPMAIGQRMVGVLALDYGNTAHAYTQGELSLTRAVADLSALVIERERLLHEQAEAQANVLALHETNRMMDEFIGIAGHELRTPLTTIKASVQLANRQVGRLLSVPDTLPAAAEKQLTVVKGHLDRTERQIGMQNRLVSDLLDVSRIHADRLELHPELRDLVTVVRDVVEDQHYLTPQRTLNLSFNTSNTSNTDNNNKAAHANGTPDEILVLADADRIRQVISNYLSNALKYSEASKPVSISVDLLDTLVRVSVRDEGPGLTLEQQQHIWDRFYRAPGIEVRTGSGVGLGLGLHISRTIIERHDGQIGVNSAPGHGSTFWFTLPLAEQKSA